MAENRRVRDLSLVILGWLLLSLGHPGVFAQEELIVETGYVDIYPSGSIISYDILCNGDLWTPEEMTTFGSQMTLFPIWTLDEPQTWAFNEFIGESSSMEMEQLAGATSLETMPRAVGSIDAYVNAYGFDGPASLGNEVSYTQTTTASGVFDFAMSMKYVSGVL